MSHQSGHEDEPHDKVPTECIVGRRIVVLHCFEGKSGKKRRKREIVIMLGHQDGTIDSLVADVSNAKHLLCRLAVALRLDQEDYNPDSTGKKWLVPHSVFRARLRVAGNVQEATRDLELTMPEVAEHLASELGSLRRALGARGRAAATPEAIVQRVHRAILVAVFAADQTR